jgi:alpha-glucuronidase
MVSIVIFIDDIDRSRHCMLRCVTSSYDCSVGGEVNAYVFFGLAWDPTQDTGLLTQEYATLTFGHENALAVSEALLLSESLWLEQR